MTAFGDFDRTSCISATPHGTSPSTPAHLRTPRCSPLARAHRPVPRSHDTDGPEVNSPCPKGKVPPPPRHKPRCPLGKSIFRSFVYIFKTFVLINKTSVYINRSFEFTFPLTVCDFTLSPCGLHVPPHGHSCLTAMRPTSQSRAATCHRRARVSAPPPRPRRCQRSGAS